MSCRWLIDCIKMPVVQDLLIFTPPSFCYQGNKPWVSLPRGKGIRLTIAEERDKRIAAKATSG